MSSIPLRIGIDDTDSPRGGCTTYTCAVLADALSKRGLGLEDHPWIVRLNPNVPWKTRGNAAVAIHVNVDESRVREVKDLATESVRAHTDLSQPRTDPALAFLTGAVPEELGAFYRKALHDIVSVSEARAVARQVRAETVSLKGSRGLVGALAALGANLTETDHTYEIIGYRTAKNCGTPRRVDPESVRLMNDSFPNETFNNLDPETGRILVTPHGPDPVLFGIRGSSPESLRAAYEMVRVHEPVERVMVFRTNHGTDAHLWKHQSTSDLRPYQSTIVSGTVVDRPVIHPGGHVFFQLEDDDGRVDCAAYEPTGRFRSVVLGLLPGDRLRAYGGVRGPDSRSDSVRATLNLEKIDIVSLADWIGPGNRQCHVCGGSCESMGSNQGVRCRKCGQKYRGRDELRTITRSSRAITTGVHVPPPRANRHLNRPASRTIGSI